MIKILNGSPIAHYNGRYIVIAFPKEDTAFIKNYVALCSFDPWEHCRGAHNEPRTFAEYVWHENDFQAGIGWSVEQRHHIGIINQHLKDK